MLDDGKDGVTVSLSLCPSINLCVCLFLSVCLYVPTQTVIGSVGSVSSTAFNYKVCLPFWLSVCLSVFFLSVYT